MEQRLQKIIADAGITSRRKAEQIILEGRVTVNGQSVSKLGSKADLEKDHIRVDGRLLAKTTEYLYLLINKPVGYVSTVKDPEGRPTVISLVKGIKQRVYPVGRLDFHSSGLMILTNDGDLANFLMARSSAIPRAYQVKLEGRPDPDGIAKLQTGIAIDGRRTEPCEIRPLGQDEKPWFEITLVEGRYHQVRRMFERIGKGVVKLKRVRIAFLTDKDLLPGSFRHLTRAEVERLKNWKGTELKPVRGPESGVRSPNFSGRSQESGARSQKTVDRTSAPRVRPQYPGADRQYPGGGPRNSGSGRQYPGGRPQEFGDRPQGSGGRPQNAGAGRPYPGARPPRLEAPGPYRGSRFEGPESGNSYHGPRPSGSGAGSQYRGSRPVGPESGPPSFGSKPPGYPPRGNSFGGRPQGPESGNSYRGPRPGGPGDGSQYREPRSEGPESGNKRFGSRPPRNGPKGKSFGGNPQRPGKSFGARPSKPGARGKSFGSKPPKPGGRNRR